MSGETLPELEMVLDETLRLYPAAWVGPRRAVETFEFGGHEVPAGAYVNYSSWASHRLPDVWPEPEAFVPERFAPEAKAQLPKGAYIPFGGGSRTCIGMRFGQLEIKTIVTLLLQRHPPRARARPHDDGAPDADAQPARAAADDGARARRAGWARRLSSPARPDR